MHILPTKHNPLAGYDLSQLHGMREDVALDIATAYAAGETPSESRVDMFRELTAELERRQAELDAWIADRA